jgi:hypothetical protein
MSDRDLPDTAPMVMPWLLDVPDVRDCARRRALHQARRRAAAARAAALTLVLPPPLPR